MGDRTGNVVPRALETRLRDCARISLHRVNLVLGVHRLLGQRFFAGDPQLTEEPVDSGYEISTKSSFESLGTEYAGYATSTIHR